MAAITIQKNPKRAIKDSTSYKIFTVCTYILVIAWTLACILPFIHMIAISLSSREFADAYQVGLWPRGFNFRSYKEAFTDAQILASLSMSVRRTVLGVIAQ